MNDRNGSIARLRGQRGETIVETLVAILISALSCTILMTAVTAAVSINKNASETQQEFESELFAAERQEETKEDSVTVKTKISTTSANQEIISEYNILITGGDGKLTSYRLKEGASDEKKE